MVMKITLWFFALMMSMSSSYAVTNWKLSEVPGPNKTVAGHIYHTESLGTRSGKSVKVYSGLRMVCSTRGEIAIVLFWNDIVALRNDTLILTSLPGKPAEPSMWHSDNGLLYLDISEAAHLLQMLKMGKVIKFQWTDTVDNHYTTAFDMSGFNISGFNTKCNTQL